MADGTHIEWTRGDDGTPGATWNPLVGCTKVSAGCDNCYAEGVVNRFAGTSSAFPNRFDVVTMRGEKMLTQPLRWRRPRRIFVNSLSDLFHADVPSAFIAQVFAVMALAPQHTFHLLTKRHARMRSLLSSRDFLAQVDDEREVLRPGCGDFVWPLPNVWIGVSVEDQHWADLRIPALLDTPAAVRWISAEPLLGPLDLRAHIRPWLVDDAGTAHARARLDWVVTGGESGPSARPMHPQWARDLRDQCARAAVPFLFKQWGRWAPQPADPLRSIAQTASFHMAADGSDVRWQDPRGTELWPVGKAAAGRELDGRLHDGYPQAVRA